MSEKDGDNEVALNDDTNDLMKITELTVDAQQIVASLFNLRIQIKNIENSVRKYEKETMKFIRYLKKNQRSRTVKKGGDIDKKDREPSGFAKKSKVKKELVDFFKHPDVINVISMISNEEDMKEDSKFEPLDDDGMINRPSVTKILNRYIKEKGLQNQSNKQIILPDDKLKKLLTPLETVDKKTGGYRCFNLQKYIKHLFI